MIRSGRLREAHEALDPLATISGQAEVHYLLGVVARLEGRLADAEERLRTALAIAPLHEDAALELARLFNGTRRHADAIACTQASAAAARPAQALLAERARAWQALDRADERLETRERIAVLYPGKASLHNFAAALGDAGYAARAEAAARGAMALGGDAPETWLVLARALQSQNRLDEADAAFGEALRRRPGYADALRDRAQLLWMTSGDIGGLMAMLDAWGGAVDDLGVRKLKASFVAAAGDPEEAYRLLLEGGKPPDAETEALASRLALAHDPARALEHARRADALAPDRPDVGSALIDALLAVREPIEAERRIARELQSAPRDQGLIAARWTAWRIMGDPRAAALYDYERTVSAQTIDTPAGWDNLNAYLADLAAALERLHGFRAHPLDQSLRGGGQTSANLLRSQDSAIRAFQQAIDGPLRRYLAFLGAGLGAGEDPLRARIEGGYAIAGMWSVRLRPGGFHHSHVHPLGWISSVCYITLPDALRDDGAGRAGWLKLGEPSVPCLAPEYFVKPEPGLLALFPSYMWHGTEPFTGDGIRLTIAFDIVPDVPRPDDAPRR